MITYIALFRGINVGGHNILPMKKLMALLENLNFKKIKTYIQSGNVVFQSDEKDSLSLSNKISSAVKKHFGFEPWILILEKSELEKAGKANPFPEAESEPKSLHIYFLSSGINKLNIKAFENIRSKTERFKLKGGIFYLYAPEGIGRSKLAANVERLIGVQVTARNWRTVSKLLEMVKEIDSKSK